MWHQFDVNRFGWLMIPPILRGKVTMALLRALLTPLVWVMELFARLRGESLTRLGRTGLVATIAEVLSKRFALTGGEIWLEDIAPDELYLYMAREDQPPLELHKASVAYPVPYVRYSDEPTTEYHFVAHVPSYLEGEDSEIRRIIDYYRPAGRNYTIHYYDYNG